MPSATININTGHASSQPHRQTPIPVLLEINKSTVVCRNNGKAFEDRWPRLQWVRGPGMQGIGSIGD